MAKIHNNISRIKNNNLRSINYSKDYDKVKEKIEQKVEDFVEKKADTYEAEVTSLMYAQGKILKYAHASGPLLAASAVGAGYAGYKLGKMAAFEAKEAVKHKSLHHAAESVALGGASVVSGATALNGAVHVATELGLKESIAHPILHGLHSVMSVAGGIYGIAEVGLGGYDIYKGIKSKDRKRLIKGALNVASGSMIVALSTTGLGLPGAIGFTAIEIAKLLHDRNLTPKQAVKLAYNKAKGVAKKIKDKFSFSKNKEKLVQEANKIDFHLADNKKVKKKK